MLVVAALAQVLLAPAYGALPSCDAAERGPVTVWDRIAREGASRYCGLVADATSTLVGTAINPLAALEWAKEADAAIPGQVAPLVLEARALLRLEKPEEALVVLRRAEALDEQALKEPQALLAWGRALARTNRRDEAITAYRQLSVLLSVLPNAERAAAETERGLLAMSYGPSQLDEALVALQMGVKLGRGDTGRVAGIGLALGRARRAAMGKPAAQTDDDSLRAAPDDGPIGILALDSDEGRDLVSVASTEGIALRAFALEKVDSASAKAAWQSYLSSGPSGPWQSFAHAHTVALGRAHTPSSSTK